MKLLALLLLLPFAAFGQLVSGTLDLTPLEGQTVDEQTTISVYTATNPCLPLSAWLLLTNLIGTNRFMKWTSQHQSQFFAVRATNALGAVIMAFQLSVATGNTQLVSGTIVSGSFGGTVETPATLGFVGGVAESSWVSNSSFVGNYTTINDYAPQQLYYPATLTSAKIWVEGTSGIVRLKLFRPIGTNRWNFITNLVTAECTPGTNTLSIPSLQGDEGDAIGVWVSNVTTRIVFIDGTYGIRYASNEQSGQNFQAPGPNIGNKRVCTYVTAEAPRTAFMGDSIMSSAPLGWGPMTPYPTGIGTNAIPRYAWMYHNRRVPYVNLAVGGSAASHVITLQLPAVTNTPTLDTAVLHVGINDINTSVSWSTFNANLNVIRGAFAGKTFVISEILPRTDSDDTMSLTQRTWNTNLSVWCATSSATLFQIHDLLGTNRVSTGQLDDLRPEYTYDGTHLTPLGKTIYASNLVNLLNSL